MQPEELITRALANDQVAQYELFTYLVSRVRPVLRIYFSPDLREDIEVGISIAYFKFLSTPPGNIQALSNVTAWMITVVKNHVRDQIRKNDKHKDCSLEWIVENGKEPEAAGFEETLMVSYAKGELAKLIEKALCHSGTVDKLIFQKYYYDHIKLEAISNDLKLTVDAVKKRKERILSLIRRFLIENGSTMSDCL